MDSVGCAAAAILIAALCPGAVTAADEIERGFELVRAGRWQEARSLLEAGQRNSPSDKRFPLELAGLEYQQKNYAAAKRDLRRALTVDPNDSYGNDFLGTLYYLDGNVEAALKYWNRLSKPKIVDLTVEPEPKVDRVLLDRAFAFAPASVVTLEQYRDTKAWVDALDVLGAYRLQIDAHPEERFDATLHWFEPSRWVQAASMLRGIAYQTVQPEWRDIGGAGLNWTNLIRWDAQKRRFMSSLEAPLRGSPKRRFQLYADARRETWNTGAPSDFRLQRIAAGAELRFIPNWRLSWHTGVEISSRRFDGAPAFTRGVALKYRTGLDSVLLHIPEHRFTLSSSLVAELGRASNLYSRGQASMAAQWLPLARGSDYEMNARLRGGKTLGNSPFDDWFQLGIERDNDLWLRGHAGTIDGKKGSAPMGRSYLLANVDFYKDLYRHGLFTIQAGPFLDTARIHDAFRRFGTEPWLVDSGAQSRIKLPGGLSVVVTYGRDLRGIRNVLYASVSR